MKFDYSDKPTKNKMHPKDKKALIIGAVLLTAIFAFGGAFAIYMHGVNFPTTPAQPVVTDNSTAADTVVPEPVVTEPVVTEPELSEIDRIRMSETLETGDLDGDGAIGIMPEGFIPNPELNEPETQPTQPATTPSEAGASTRHPGVFIDEPNPVDGSDGYTGDRNIAGTGEQVGHM